MLVFKKLTWSNCFSYAEQNIIYFDKNPLTQLTGANGAGKTSIALILQEILYGKNNKNIKKADISNNKTDVKGYYIKLDFNKDGIDYQIELDRKTSLKLHLYKGDEDISSHSSLDTYKTISNIIGVTDFKVFCQLIYQHSTDSLDFLTATDTNRKRFLISLLQLDKYLELFELFKSKVLITNSEIVGVKGNVETLESWISKHEHMELIKQNLLQVEKIPENFYSSRETLKQNIANINSINLKIASNNQYKKELRELDSKYYLGSAPARPSPSSIRLQMDISILHAEQKRYKAINRKLITVKGSCPNCLQPINEIAKLSLIKANEQSISTLKETIEDLTKQVKEHALIEIKISKYTSTKESFERLNRSIDSSIASNTLNLIHEREKLNNLESRISKIESNISNAQAENLKISAHNSKVDVVKNQLKEFNKELFDKNNDLIDKENLNSILELLKKTFGTNGLVSYKIESSVKELEMKINEYLSELSHFQLYFKLAGEKLNIEILDEFGNVMSMSNLSSGEKARTNLATVLSIRSILTSLTNTKINLLFLDEITGSLDAEGKEKFSEILLRENLNTFFVSHEWSHPLIPRINIVKEHHISRIEND